MRISKINSYNYNSSINFSSKVKRVLLGNIDEKMKEKVDSFEETHENAKLLGKGLFAQAYLFPDSNIVIKESIPSEQARIANGNFLSEAINLSRLPEQLTNTQRLVADVETEKGNYYLLSTLVEGKKPDFSTVFWDKSSFKSLFSNMLELDKAGILHGDLNRGNCLLDNGTVNLIDYQWADTFDIDNPDENDNKFKFPDFMMPANSQMFEMANLPYYFSRLNEDNPEFSLTDLFKTYLNEKSQYCKNRANYLRGNGASPEMVEYEQLQAKFLNNPTDEVVKLEAMKLQLLYAFRQSFSMVDKNNAGKHNIISSVSSYLYTALCGKSLANMAEQLKENSTDVQFRKFMDYEKRFGEYWKNKIIDELSGSKLSADGEYGTFKWVVRNAQLNPHWKNGKVDIDDDISDKFQSSMNKEFGLVNDISSVLSDKQTELKQGTLQISDDTKKKFDKANEVIGEFANKLPPRTVLYARNVRALNILSKNFTNSFYDSYYAMQQKDVLSCMSASIKALYNASVLKKEADNFYIKVDKSLEPYAKEQMSLSGYSIHALYHIIQNLYKDIMEKIEEDDKDINYTNLNEFNVKKAVN